MNALLLASLILSPLAGSSLTVEDPIPAALAKISPKRLMADVETLVGFGTRHTLSDTRSSERGIGAARRWLYDEFETISRANGHRLQVREQRFLINIRGKEAELVNIYGFLPGRDKDSNARTYVVSGHYDSIPSGGMDAETDAPGADDDASGTAVVLELARVLAGGEYDANLMFICVAGEEQGLFGSKHCAQQMHDDGVAIDGMITNDIVGGIEGGNGVRDARTIRCFSRAENGLHSASRSLARAMSASAKRYTPAAKLKLIFRLDRFGRGGDHKPFDELGYPAIRMTEANEHYARQHKDVGTRDGIEYGDLPAFVSADYMALVASVNGACLAELALAPAPPSPPGLLAAMSYDTQVYWEPVEGAAGYEVVWRDTTSPDWEHVRAVGTETTEVRTRRGRKQAVSINIEGVTADSNFFGVRSLSASGHRSRVIVPERP
ncbi:MAG: hypothetical protein ACI841_000346 [Planctomycetota bacterium]|jgi:hypothetical protein